MTQRVIAVVAMLCGVVGGVVGVVAAFAAAGGGGGRPAAKGEGVASAVAGGASSQVAVIELPQGAPGIGFDDLQLGPAQDRLLIPAGRSGRLDLVDPTTRAVWAITGFSAKERYAGGHDDGVTSAVAAGDVIYATDRTSQRLAVIDAAARRIVRSVALAAHPDYIRHVAPTHELWVTQPDADQIEVFGIGADPRQPKHAAVIAVAGGPESLVIDAGRSRAYTHLWRGATVALDLQTRAVVGKWKNGCRSSRGIVLDAARGQIISACAEGKVTVVDVQHHRVVSELQTGGGVDVIDYDPAAHRVYIPCAHTATLVVASLAADGHLARLGTLHAPGAGHCVVVDRRGNAYVCDPAHGRLLVLHDGLRRRDR